MQKTLDYAAISTVAKTDNKASPMSDWFLLGLDFWTISMETAKSCVIIAFESW